MTTLRDKESRQRLVTQLRQQRDEARRLGRELAALETQADVLWRNLGWNRSRAELGIALEHGARPLLTRVKDLETELAKRGGK